MDKFIWPLLKLMSRILDITTYLVQNDSAAWQERSMSELLNTGDPFFGAKWKAYGDTKCYIFSPFFTIHMFLWITIFFSWLFNRVYNDKVGGAVASWLVRARRVRALAGTLCRVLGQDTTLMVPLSTQVYKWIPANLVLGVTLRWTSIPSRGE